MPKIILETPYKFETMEKWLIGPSCMLSKFFCSTERGVEHCEQSGPVANNSA